MLDYTIATIAGILLGIITGLLPGIHINSVIVLMLEFMQKITPQAATAIISMSITNQVVSFTPSILFGMPSEQNYTSTLTGHEFARKGMALHAIRLCTIGATAGLIIAIITTPIIIAFLEKTTDYFTAITQAILTIILALMVLREKTLEQKKWAAIIIILSSGTGFFLLNNSLFTNNIFILVTGFFGLPTIILALTEKNFMPKQKKITKKTSLKKTTKTGALSNIAAMIGTVFPALSPNEMIFLASEFRNKTSKTKYLLLSGGVATATFFYSFIAVLFIGKARNASAEAIKQTQNLPPEFTIITIIASITACCIGALASEFFAKKIIEKTEKINYTTLNKAILFFIIGLSFFTGGFFGLIALASATSTGLLAVNADIKRSTCMAFLIAPTIMLYLAL